MKRLLPPLSHQFSLALAAGILIVTIVPAHAANTSITMCPFTISNPGNYTIDANLSCSGDAITITSSNTTLTLNNHTITGTANSGNGIHIVPASERLDHVGIQGPGLIQGFSIGIKVEEADYSQVNLVGLLKNATGISATDVNYQTVGSNVIGRSVGYGLEMIASNFSTVSLNSLSGNGNGIRLFGGGNGNTVNNNTSDGNAGDGIEIGDDQNTRVYGNVTNGNGGNGIEVLAGATGTQVFSNTSSTVNGLFDLDDHSSTCGGNRSNFNTGAVLPPCSNVDTGVFTRITIASTPTCVFLASTLIAGTGFTVTKQPDSCSPTLIELATSNIPVSSVMISLLEFMPASNMEVGRVTLNNVKVSISFDPGGTEIVQFMETSSASAPPITPVSPFTFRATVEADGINICTFNVSSIEYSNTDVSITKSEDTCSTRLLEFTTNGTHLDKVVITVYVGDKKATDLTITLEEVTITSIFGSLGSNGIFAEVVNFVFGKYESDWISEVQQDSGRLP